MQASKLLMIQPVNFMFNAETAVNNAFQKELTSTDVQEKALEEFNAFVNLLEENRVNVTVVKDSLEPATPDSIFPNNWISFHEDNSIFLYPMFASNRRLERKEHVLEIIKKKFHLDTIHDLSYYEKQGSFLEGTGSMVLDRTNKIVYASISSRTDIRILREFCRITNYLPVSFLSKDQYGNLIYHSNVMMCIADAFVVICLQAIEDKIEREKIRLLLVKTKKEIIEITFEQLDRFAGNMLQVANEDAELLLVMSTQAFHSLTSEQVNKLSSYNRILHTPLDTIETCGGGSARCMIAEVFNDAK
ncbi:MAG: arginine deiminase-related protein [Ferruginibacter sp.]